MPPAVFSEAAVVDVASVLPDMANDPAVTTPVVVTAALDKSPVEGL
jgi:hypothetical protein